MRKVRAESASGEQNHKATEPPPPLPIEVQEASEILGSAPVLKRGDKISLDELKKLIATLGS